MRFHCLRNKHIKTSDSLLTKSDCALQQFGKHRVIYYIYYYRKIAYHFVTYRTCVNVGIHTHRSGIDKHVAFIILQTLIRNMLAIAAFRSVSRGNFYALCAHLFKYITHRFTCSAASQYDKALSLNLYAVDFQQFAESVRVGIVAVQSSARFNNGVDRAYALGFLRCTVEIFKHFFFIRHGDVESVILQQQLFATAFHILHRYLRDLVYALFFIIIKIRLMYLRRHRMCEFFTYYAIFLHNFTFSV